MYAIRSYYVSLFGLGVDVTTGVEHVPIEEFGGAGFPQTQDVNGLAFIADYRDIPRYPFDLLTGVPHLLHLAVFAEHGFDVAVEGNFLNGFRTADFPGVAVFAPGIRTLDLTAVADLLTEQAVLVVQTVADGRQVQGSQGVDEAGSQTTQTSYNFV